MPNNTIHTQVDGQKIKLTNLDKILYESIGLVKAQVIEYYIAVSDYILPHIQMRPMTLIRFPDGVGKKQFYSKEVPSWSPDWIRKVAIAHSNGTNQYMYVDGQASLVWLANLAALELHPMQSTVSQLDRPDHWIIDLDPDESISFDNVKEVALQMREFLSTYDYRPLIKTSGGKGLHIIVPIEGSVQYEAMTEAIKDLMKEFIKIVNPSCTLHVHKIKRKGKILLDVYRNHQHNTTVAPYSLRGRKGAPVSMPIEWTEVPSLRSAQDFSILTVPTLLKEKDNPWADWHDHAVPMHVTRSTLVVASLDSTKLTEYNRKRNFKKTREPAGHDSSDNMQRFVIQLHDASNLHYDLRLEIDGVLQSWAILKGLPEGGQKRLAIRTEDHPVKYLDYEGVIPKGEYGEGAMWIYAKGTYKWIKNKEGSYTFTLIGPNMHRSFHLFNTKDEQWLMENLDKSYFSPFDLSIRPMLADLQKKWKDPKSQHQYEIKWDGIRVLIFIRNHEVTVMSRNGNDLTAQFPEISQAIKDIELESGILDGELVCLDDVGRPIFSKIISRMHTRGNQTIHSRSVTNPAYCYLFDLISLDGLMIAAQPLHRRQAWLRACLKKQDVFRLSEVFENGRELYEHAEKLGLEGIMIKDKNSPYRIGKRSSDWLKLKYRKKDICYIIGYTRGEGHRAVAFGSLHLAKKEGNLWRYMGKVGTGFNVEKLKEIHRNISQHAIKKKYISESVEEEHKTTWIEPIYQCQIEYASLTSNHTYREPVFLTMFSAIN